MERLVDVVERILGRDVPQRGFRFDEMAKAVSGKILMMPGILVEKQQGLVWGFAAFLKHHQDVGIRRVQDVGGAFFIENGVSFFDLIDLRDKGAEVSAGIFPIGGCGFNNVEWFGKTEFEPERDHDPGGKEGGEKVALLHSIDIALALGKKSGGIVAFGKADGWGNLAKQVVLRDEPGIFEVPVPGTVEHIVETCPGGFFGQLRWAAKSFGGEKEAGMARPSVVDEPLPEPGGDFVSGIAPKTIKTQRDKVFDNPQAVTVKALWIRGVFMIKLGQVLPNDFLLIVDAKSIGNASVRLVHKPLGMFFSEGRINGAVVEDEVNHQLETGSPGLINYLEKLLFSGSRAFGS